MTAGAVSLGPWADHLGIEVGEVGEGTATLTMALGTAHMNFLDSAHGGALFSLAAAAARVAGGVDGELLDAHLVLTAGGAAGDVFEAEARPVREGRTLSVYRVSVHRSDGTKVGELTATLRSGS